jgi:hypothetical protein
MLNSKVYPGMANEKWQMENGKLFLGADLAYYFHPIPAKRLNYSPFPIYYLARPKNAD